MNSTLWEFLQSKANLAEKTFEELTDNKWILINNTLTVIAIASP